MSCAVYYWLWIFILPKIGGYRIRQELLVLENGAQSHRVVKVSLAELAQWDASHDAIGRSLTNAPVDSGDGLEKKIT